MVDTNKEPSECFDRVNKVANGAKVGKWTAELDAKLEKLYQKYRNNWTLIAKYMPSKSAKTIRERYVQVIEPRIKMLK